MINFMYLLLPIIFTVVLTLIVSQPDVEKANKELINN